MKYLPLCVKKLFVITIISFLSIDGFCETTDKALLDKKKVNEKSEKIQLLSPLHLETTYLIINTEDDKLKKHAEKYAKFAKEHPETTVDCINARLLIYFHLKDLSNYSKTVVKLYKLITPAGQVSNWRQKVYMKHLNHSDMSNYDRNDWNEFIISEVIKTVPPFPDKDYIDILKTYMIYHQFSMKPADIEVIVSTIKKKLGGKNSPIIEELMFIAFKSATRNSSMWDKQVELAKKYFDTYGKNGKFSENIYSYLIRGVTGRDILHNLKGRRRKEDDPEFWYKQWKKDFATKYTKYSEQIKKYYESWLAKKERLEKGFGVNITPKDNKRFLSGWVIRVKERNDVFILLLTGKKAIYKLGEPIKFTAKLKYRGKIITSMVVADKTFPMVLSAGGLGIPRPDKERYNELFSRKQQGRVLALANALEKGEGAKLSFRKGSVKSFQVNNKNTPMLKKLPIGTHKFNLMMWYKYQGENGKDYIKPLNSNEFVIDIVK